MHGIFNIYKPPQVSSFSVIGTVRRLAHERRVGHAGILDIPAEGVLPVAIGEGTRIIEFLYSLPKTYLAQIELGVTTDTYDATGKVIRRGDASSVCRDDILEVLRLFQGELEQIPPVYSALKYRGRRASDWSRQGVKVELTPRRVHIYRLEMLDFSPPRLTLEVECGRGFYIRSLAFDIGQKLGCGAYLSSLVRTRYGPFDIEGAIPFEELAQQKGQLEKFLYPMDTPLKHLPQVTLNNADSAKVQKGAPVVCECVDMGFESWLRAYDTEGRLVAVLEGRGDGKWWPRKVFKH